ncbi:caspase domain-containing protein [Xylanibacter ruminicola]|jgi:predicted small secreted protein|uniref:Caspase domain-containing protein n=1 Tax=Xylanibacter ruminicola TaxID=839 RepID=A0A1M6TAD7_XYLRU|nr:caspase family protein [Xylanibacter ruminicola]SHK53698.1 Caspase domain-containing protein [Xylanibacter ruminicola]
MKRLFIITLVFATMTQMGWAQRDVDTYVAVNEEQDPNTFAVIISNEHYKHEAGVPFALNDGAIFKRYLMKTLGVPEQNIKYVPDASLNDMNYNLAWLEKVINVKKNEARAIVYYSGHGMPDEDSKKAYLLPVDGYSTEPTSGLSTEALYKRLGAMPSSQTLVFLDACFSGSKREGDMMKAARGVAIKAKSAPVTGKMVVFSAAQGNETAYPLNTKEHGMFTYFLLEKLQKTGGAVTLGELSEYVTKNVAETSIITNDKSQTPTVTAPVGSNDWRNWKMANNAAKKFETLPKFVPAAQTPAAGQNGQQAEPAKHKPAVKSILKKRNSTTTSAE